MWITEHHHLCITVTLSHYHTIIHNLCIAEHYNLCMWINGHHHAQGCPQPNPATAFTDVASPSIHAFISRAMQLAEGLPLGQAGLDGLKLSDFL